MSSADPTPLAELAKLARLGLTPDELLRLEPEFERILEAFAVLARHPLTARAEEGTLPAVPAREDEPLPSLARDLLLAAAPAAEDGFYSVPKTVGGEG